MFYYINIMTILWDIFHFIIFNCFVLFLFCFLFLFLCFCVFLCSCVFVIFCVLCFVFCVLCFLFFVFYLLFVLCILIPSYKYITTNKRNFIIYNNKFLVMRPRGWYHSRQWLQRHLK
jgi:hypothetical protein